MSNVQYLTADTLRCWRIPNGVRLTASLRSTRRRESCLCSPYPGTGSAYDAATETCRSMEPVWVWERATEGLNYLGSFSRWALSIS